MTLPRRWRIILPIVAFLFGWGAGWFVLGKPVIVAGSSMQPTLKDGDCMLLFRNLPWSPITRGDVVVLKDDQGEAVKRIVGLPGEDLQLNGGRVLVNGFVLHEPYLSRNTQTTPSRKGAMFTLAAGQYFVLGDNRAESFDSRDYGPISASQIIGAIDVDHRQPVRYLFRPSASVQAQGRDQSED